MVSLQSGWPRGSRVLLCTSLSREDVSGPCRRLINLLREFRPLLKARPSTPCSWDSNAWTSPQTSLRNQLAERVERALLSTSALIALGLLFGRLPSLLLFFEQEVLGVKVRQYFVGFLHVEMAVFNCRPHRWSRRQAKRPTGADAARISGIEYVPPAPAGICAAPVIPSLPSPTRRLLQCVHTWLKHLPSPMRHQLQ